MRSVARRPCEQDPHGYHAVVFALSKARAMASVLDDLAETGINDLVCAIEDGRHPEETRDWLHAVVADALRAALDETEAEFRKSLTPEQAREQVFSPRKARTTRRRKSPPASNVRQLHSDGA